MIIDFHASCGPVPKTGRDWTLADLGNDMQKAGVEMALVESIQAKIHRGEGPHNQLISDCRAAGPAFLPSATIHLESDQMAPALARTARSRGFARVVLQGTLYEENRLLEEILTNLSADPLPVYRAFRMEEIDLLYRVVRKYPSLSFVVSPICYHAIELFHKLMELPNAYLSTARSLVCIGQLESACRRLGAERVLYASDWPNQHLARVMGMIMDAEVSDTEKAMVLGGSARKLLGRHGIILPGKEEPPRRLQAPCPVIDAHGHIGTDYRRLDFDWSMECMLRRLDQIGTETIYVSSTEAIFGDVKWGNRRTEEIMRRFPNRIRSYLVINPFMGEACLEDIRTCRQRGFVGLKPYPPGIGHKMSDPVMDPVLDLALEMKMPLLCHTDAADLRRMLEKRPRLRILAAHMSFEYEEKARLAGEFANVMLEMSGAGAAGPADVLKAIQLAGEDKMVFGSDLNTNPPGYSLYPILCSGLSSTTLKKLLRENAIRFFEGCK